MDSWCFKLVRMQRPVQLPPRHFKEDVERTVQHLDDRSTRSLVVNIRRYIYFSDVRAPFVVEDGINTIKMKEM